MTGIAVLGAGHWGAALAVYLARRGWPVALWGHDHRKMAELGRRSDLAPLYPALEKPPGLSCSADLAVSLAGAEVVFLVVPSHALRATLRLAAPHISSGRFLALASKGLEIASGRRLDQVIDEELPGHAMAVVSGPTFADEIVRGLPAALTVASVVPTVAEAVAARLRGPQLRAYTSDDVAGVCLGGAIKNVIAIAAGISDGLGNGHSARAALITRGLAELHRLGTALGGRTETFMGLAGAGDLILTATSPISRNYRVGLGLGRGGELPAVLASIGQEAEGVRTAQALYGLAGRQGVEMPITEHVYKVLYEGLAPHAASEALMQREPKTEVPASAQGRSAPN